MTGNAPDMSSRRPFWHRPRLWLTVAVVVGLALSALMMGRSGPSPFSPPIPAVGQSALYKDELEAPSRSLREPGLDVAELADRIYRHLEDRMQTWLTGHQSTERKQQEERDARVQSQLEEMAEQLGVQSTQIIAIEQQIQNLHQRIEQWQATPAESEVAGLIPPFTFRGIEVWHGHVYALLSYEGRILPARQGETRLGWQLRVIDREQRQLHVSNGSIDKLLVLP